MGRQALERKLESIEALRTAPPSEALEQLRKALRDRNNYAVSKAAALAARLQLHALVPDLVAAFDRSMTDPVKSDPQCWAKNAIAKSLAALGHQDPTVFLRGLAHVQPEPVWGGREDTATVLRGACAAALPGCRIGDVDVLSHLLEALADPAKTVRAEAARAIAQVACAESALLLRLKALTGDREPEVTGQCLASLLSLAPADSVPFAARFLSHADPDLRTEAAAALAASHEPAALEALAHHWERERDVSVKRAVLAFFGASPLEQAAEFLLQAIEAFPAEALNALAASRFRAQFEPRVAAAVAASDDPHLEQLYRERFTA